MKREFVCNWEYSKRSSLLKIKDIKRIIDNLGIEIVNIKEENLDPRRINVTFTLKGTEEQQKRLQYYVTRIIPLSI